MKHIKWTIEKRKECVDFILGHHNSLTQPEIAAQLKIGTSSVTRLMNELGLKQRHYKKRNPRPALERKSGMFNVKRHRNWLVG